MIVCLCRNVSDRALGALARTGRSDREIRNLTGAGLECGRCEQDVGAAIKSARRACSTFPPCPGCPDRAPEPVAGGDRSRRLAPREAA